MPRQTLRSWLSTPNLSIISVPSASASTRPGDAQWDVVDEWERWDGFSPTNINILLGPVLDKEYDFPSLPPRPHPALLSVANERSFEYALIRWNNIIVNTALEVVCGPTGHLCWGAGSSAKMIDRRYPDWASVHDSSTAYERPNPLPGESKFFCESFPEKADIDQESGVHATARSYLEQVNFYAKDCNTRYCYLITPKDLVVVRRTAYESPPPSEALAGQRARRNASAASASASASTPHISTSPASPHTPNTRNHATARGTPSAQSPHTPLQPGSASTGTYSPGPRSDVSLEVACVSWDPPPTANDLTVNLALFVLNLLARADNAVRTRYPQLHLDSAYHRLRSL